MKPWKNETIALKNANVSKRSTTIINFEKYGKAISLIIFPKHSQHKKIRFPLRISSVNVTKSAGNIWLHLLKKFLKETSFCAVMFSNTVVPKVQKQPTEVFC